jgi:hypothetical protein
MSALKELSSRGITSGDLVVELGCVFVANSLFPNS